MIFTSEELLSTEYQNNNPFWAENKDLFEDMTQETPVLLRVDDKNGRRKKSPKKPSSPCLSGSGDNKLR